MKTTNNRALPHHLNLFVRTFLLCELVVCERFFVCEHFDVCEHSAVCEHFVVCGHVIKRTEGLDQTQNLLL